MDIASVVGAVSHSVWLIPVLAVLIALDGPIPVLPSEAVLVTTAAIAFEEGRYLMIGVLLVVAISASLLGDIGCFGLGRSANRLIKHPPEGRWADWVRRNLLARPGIALVGARFMPGGRLVSTMGSGRFGLAPRRFLVWAGVSATFWSVYMLSVGRLLQPLAERSPLLCMGAHMLLGLVMSSAFAVVGRVLSARSARGIAPVVVVDRLQDDESETEQAAA